MRGQIEEQYGSTSLQRSYTRRSNGRYNIISTNKNMGVSNLFRTVFLPQGYPESVSEDYLTYQVWDTVQAFASSITGTLAAQAVLKGVGVGDESATVLAATFTWLLKDGTGMLGRILFAWLQGTHLDCDAKRWRLFADIINDLAIFLEILGPNCPSIFTLILCISGVLKSIVGVAGGATRAALTLHQARRNNMADVSAKDGSQETLVNLLGLICNLMLVPIVTGRHMLIWTLYIIFTSLHLYANYSAVKAVIMETLNQARLHIVLQEYFRTGTISYTSVNNVNKREPVLWSTQRKFNIHLGASLKNLYDSLYNVDELFTIFQNSRYILWVNRKAGDIHIALHSTADHIDQLQACYHAELINFIAENLDNTLISNSNMQDVISAYRSGDIDLIQTSHNYVQKTFSQFTEDISRNRWKTNVTLLCADEWRIVG